jgi:hypothetical protein
MTTLGILVRPEAKASNACGQVSSARIKTTKQDPHNLHTCRQHGTWPGFWQQASAHGRPFGMACPSQSDTSFMLSAISTIAVDCRRDWHSRCTSVYRGNACKALGTSHHRMIPFAMVALLAVAFGFNPAARAQDIPAPSTAKGQVQSVGNNSTQESN